MFSALGEIGLLCLALFYATAIVWGVLGMFRIPRSQPVPVQKLPRVSVICSARNESRDLPSCLRALLALDYPRDRLEIMLVDDQSDDDTLALMQAAAAQHEHITVLQSGQAPAVWRRKLKAKALGVAWGAHHATGEWLLITDADGEVPSTWLRHMLWRAGPDVGMVGGCLEVIPHTLVGHVERSLGAVIYPLGVGLPGHGRPFPAIGPNMAMRRSVYVAAGGLEHSGVKVAEDVALYRMVIAAGMRVIHHADPQTTVRVHEVPSFLHLISQYRRWMLGGYEGPRFLQITATIAVGLCIVVSWLLAAALVLVPKTALVAFAIKALGDLGAMGVIRQRFGRPGVCRYWPLSQVASFVGFCILGTSLLLAPRITWRGDNFAVRYQNAR